MAKDTREINLGLGELLGESNIVREEEASLEQAPKDDLVPSADQQKLASLDSAAAVEATAAQSEHIVQPMAEVVEVLRVQERRVPRRRYGLGVGVLIGCLFGVWLLSSSGLDPEGGEVAIPDGAQKVAEITGPALQPLDTGVLGGLIADLERGAGPRAAAPLVGASPPAPNPPSAPNSPSVAVVALNRVQVDLKGPVEPAMVKEARETYRRNGGSEYANGQQDGASPFGPEKLPPFGGRRGKIIQGGETYRMLRHTMVFSEPDDRGAEIAELYTGDRVLAEEKVGQWLKIRSQKGREGYIPMRVAEPLSEYYQRVPWEAPNGTGGLFPSR